MIAATTPVAATERMDVLDVIRGVAVLGILVVNIYAFSGYDFISPSQRAALPASRFDELADFAVGFLAEGKFYCLFSFLFGVGFSVFIQRASARGLAADAIRLFKRRLVGLLLIGLVHSILIWFGDILATYAVLGFALIPFVRRDDRSVLRWATIMLLAPIGLYTVLLGLASLGPAPPPQAAGMGLPPILVTAIDGIARGNYLDLVRGNVIFTIGNVLRRLILMFFPRVLGMFLLGFYAGRAGIFANLDAHAPLLRRVCAAGFAVGLPLSFLVAAFSSDDPRPPDLRGILDTTLQSIAAPALALGYAAGLCLLFRRAPKAMQALAPVGRMALTSYLTHSVVGVLVFYGIGLRLFGRVSLTMALAGCVGFFVVQMIASRAWLAIALFGPAEWLWRSFTYRKRFRLLK